MSGFNKDNFFEPEDDTSTFERSPELLVNTPSRAEGVDERTETMLRVYGCELIQEAGILLRMHQTACITGQIIFHRFYFRVSMKRCEVRSVAKAALLLGGKIEEEPRKLHDILNVFHAAALRRHNRKVEPLVAGTKRYLEMKEDILKAEQAILRELGFIIHAEHAHKFVFYYIRVLLAKGFNEQYPELAQRAWNYANDLYRSIICLKFRPNVLACGAIFLASRDLKIPLPEPTWWELFDVQQPQVYEVATGILSLYKLSKAHNINLRDEPDKDLEEGKVADEGNKPGSSTEKLPQGAAALASDAGAENGVAQAASGVAASDSKDGAADKPLEEAVFAASTPDPSSASDKAQRNETASGAKGGGSDKGERKDDRGDRKDDRRGSPPADRDRGGSRRDDRRGDIRGRDVRDRERDKERDRSRSRDRGGGGAGGRGGNRERISPGRRGSGRNHRSPSPVRRRSRTPDRNVRRGDLRDSLHSSRGGRDKMARDRERDRSPSSRDRERGSGRGGSPGGGRGERDGRKGDGTAGSRSRSRERSRSRSRSKSKSKSASPGLVEMVKSRKEGRGAGALGSSNGSRPAGGGKVAEGRDGGDKGDKDTGDKGDKDKGDKGEERVTAAAEDVGKDDEERLRKRAQKFGTGGGGGGGVGRGNGAGGPSSADGGKGGGREELGAKADVKDKALAVSTDAAGGGNEKIKSPRNAPRSPRKSPKLAPASAAGKGLPESAAKAQDAKDEAVGGRKKFKVQIGQRDDLKDGK